ncbi:hypothetical protein [Streptomyces kaniharaensis]|uniref:hypothetical protein n=1 Tax=Streptomyces kaniharaensis TaxID=212423 RepID=UPI001297A506|nr:hypothetical protein [Streptomyces kaniharaensis]
MPKVPEGEVLAALVVVDGFSGDVLGEGLEGLGDIRAQQRMGAVLARMEVLTHERAGA